MFDKMINENNNKMKKINMLFINKEVNYKITNFIMN